MVPPFIHHANITLTASGIAGCADNMALEVQRASFALPQNRYGRPPREPTRVKITYVHNQEQASMKRTSATDVRELIMPVSTGSQSLLATFPSFMSVFRDGVDARGTQMVDAAGTTTQLPNKTLHTNKRPNNTGQVSSPIARRDSSSTFESTESSPTTTISTVESSITEPSPSSSPESPTSLLPLSSFKYLRTNSVPTQGVMMDNKDQFSNSFPTLPGLERSERSDSPDKKMRNMKNLSVNTSASNRQATQLSKAGMPSTIASSSGHAFSAPATPAFIVPPKVPRKKPSKLGLSITTPDTDPSPSSSQDKPRLVPQTPSDHQIQTLRLLQNPSSGPLFSPTHAPEGGMRLPPLSNSSMPSRFGKSGPPLSISPHSSIDTSNGSPVTKQTLDHVQEECDYELPLSQEAKSPAYPQGPVCIYDPHVYLYLEPSHIEAREFDVVLNVAREVLNPFTRASENEAEQKTADKGVQVSFDPNNTLAGRDDIQEPATATSEKSFRSAFESQLDDADRTIPSTPKATRPQPEYVHVPWDHNTNVVDDLLRLCELIDDRVRQEKRVLVHCQCGVSRSASLVVAYGLYKNPKLTVQEAYDAVKNRSRWIGPNMNLIYQLSEFKSKLAKASVSGMHSWHSWRALGSGRLNPNATRSPDGLSLRSSPQKSLSAPSPLEANSTRANTYSPPGSAQLAAPPAGGDITPGPSSAPPGMQFGDSEADGEIERAHTASPPRMMDIDTDLSMSPMADGQEGIQAKALAPTGGVANDLQEVARDLDHNEHNAATTSPPRFMEIDSTETLLSPPETRLSEPNQIDAKPKSPPTQLPAGFSSLLTRRQGLQRLPLRQEPSRFASDMSTAPALNTILNDDVPPTPSLLSPRATEFTASPFHRTAAGDLAGSSVFEQGLMSPIAVEEDPRSPHQKGEAPITRSIFDFI